MDLTKLQLSELMCKHAAKGNMIFEQKTQNTVQKSLFLNSILLLLLINHQF